MERSLDVLSICDFAVHGITPSEWLEIYPWTGLNANTRDHALAQFFFPSSIHSQLGAQYRTYRQRPYGSALLPRACEWRVMKPIPLRTIAAPSPTVLNFLRSQVRNAFDSPTWRCATLETQGHRHASTCARVGQLGSRRRGTGSIGRGVVQIPASSSPRQCSTLNSIPNREYASRFPTDPLIPPSSCRRTFSTTQSHSWRFWPSRRRPLPPPLKPHISPLGAVADDASNGLYGLGRTARSANELKMRCTELDESGNVTMVSGEFKKSELIAKVCGIAIPFHDWK